MSRLIMTAIFSATVLGAVASAMAGSYDGRQTFAAGGNLGVWQNGYHFDKP